jgi:hypothetical protein
LKISKDFSCLTFPFQYRKRPMKRISTLIVLIGLVMGAVLTGCDSGNKPDAAAPGADATKKAAGEAAATNTPPAAPK